MGDYTVEIGKEEESLAFILSSEEMSPSEADIWIGF